MTPFACRQCGGPPTGCYQGRKYCSRECKRLGKNKHARVWRLSQPDLLQYERRHRKNRMADEEYRAAFNLKARVRAALRKAGATADQSARTRQNYRRYYEKHAAKRSADSSKRTKKVRSVYQAVVSIFPEIKSQRPDYLTYTAWYWSVYRSALELFPDLVQELNNAES